MVRLSSVREVQTSQEGNIVAGTLTPTLVSAEEFADMIGVTTRTLRLWRFRGEGPPFHRLGKLIKYDVSPGGQVDQWLSSRIEVPGSSS
jgi:hypothetical protein